MQAYQRKLAAQTMASLTGVQIEINIPNFVPAV